MSNNEALFWQHLGRAADCFCYAMGYLEDTRGKVDAEDKKWFATCAAHCLFACGEAIGNAGRFYNYQHIDVCAFYREIEKYIREVLADLLISG